MAVIIVIVKEKIYKYQKNTSNYDKSNQEVEYNSYVNNDNNINDNGDITKSNDKAYHI